ncbi:MAG TPA: cell division protein ZapA [Sphingomonadaceae bacterium]|nr:cell division protein ZapA [Sphingomonadaceae bacterium]
MAEVDIEIGGHRYLLSCRDGDEDQLRASASLVDEKAFEAARAVGGLSEVRQLLFAALLLADEIHDLRAGRPVPASPSSAESDAMLASALERLAQRMETLANRVETTAPNA